MTLHLQTAFAFGLFFSVKSAFGIYIQQRKRDYLQVENYEGIMGLRSK